METLNGIIGSKGPKVLRILKYITKLISKKVDSIHVHLPALSVNLFKTFTNLLRWKMLFYFFIRNKEILILILFLY